MLPEDLKCIEQHKQKIKEFQETLVGCVSRLNELINTAGDASAETLIQASNVNFIDASITKFELHLAEHRIDDLSARVLTLETMLAEKDQ